MFLRLSVILFTGGGVPGQAHPPRTRGTLPGTRGRSPHCDQRQVPPPRTGCRYPSPGPEAGTPLPHQVHPLDQRQIPPNQVHPHLLGRYTPLPHQQVHPTSLAGIPPSPTGRYTPHTVHAWRYRQEAGGMHPTGMQSCCKVVFTLNNTNAEIISLNRSEKHINQCTSGEE